MLLLNSQFSLASVSPIAMRQRRNRTEKDMAKQDQEEEEEEKKRRDTQIRINTIDAESSLCICLSRLKKSTCPLEKKQQEDFKASICSNGS